MNYVIKELTIKNFSSGIISQNEKLKANIIEKRRGVNGG
jgi:hypothetical protein